MVGLRQKEAEVLETEQHLDLVTQVPLESLLERVEDSRFLG